MTIGETFDFTRTERPTSRAGAACWHYAARDGEMGNAYIPYFYNPALDGDARRMIFCGERDGETQAYLLDLDRAGATQLTGAAGRGQNWAPYIRENVRGIRPQFIAWAQPGYDGVLYWENNDLCLVDPATLASERLYHLRDDAAPAVLHCSPGGWVAFGYLPRDRQERLRQGASVPEIDAELRQGCGFCVYDLGRRELLLDVATPFWPNHVAAAPDHSRILCCHEGSWQEQRMYLYDVAAGEVAPLRPQEDGAQIGHEFWIDDRRVGYHGALGEHGFFGVIDTITGERAERPSPPGQGHHYAHYHVSPDARFIVTDGEVTPDRLSIAPLGGDLLAFAPVCAHNWARQGDQRVHPHPNWHRSGRFITFTACETAPDGGIRSSICLLDLGDAPM